MEMGGTSGFALFFCEQPVGAADCPYESYLLKDFPQGLAPYRLK